MKIEKRVQQGNWLKKKKKNAEWIQQEIATSTINQKMLC
jgi:hypothetical protein